MNKLAWVGVAAVAAALLLSLWLFLIPVNHVPPPDKLIDNATTTQTAQPPPTTAAKPPSTATEPSPRPSTAIRLPFNASSYEANYTIVFSVSAGGITVTIEGWMVIGTGPSGNYSFGLLIIPLRGAATYKTVTMEDNATYTLTCALNYCRAVEEEEWPFTRLIDGINVTRTVLGQCRHLNYTGVLYKEYGILDPKALRRLLQEMSGNYTAYVCEVNGVALSADLVSTAVIYDTSVRVTLKLEAVKVGPYSPETYRQILQEVEEALRNESTD